jgi:hypothetical protein
LFVSTRTADIIDDKITSKGNRMIDGATNVLFISFRDKKQCIFLEPKVNIL